MTKKTKPHGLMSRIRIVLVETTHPGNIGAAARAMKTMGQKRLYLVKPKIFPSADVTARAAGADDVLADTTVCETLQDAIRDCIFVVGTTARSRRIPWPIMTPRECTEKILATAGSGDVAILFGRENSGLNNEELELCNMVIQIPANPEYSSLNVASAVQIICYEIMQAGLSYARSTKEEAPPATAKEMQQFYEHFEEVMIEVGFYNPEKPRRLIRRIKRLFNRAQPDQKEVNMLRGFLSGVQEKLGKK